MNGQELVEAMSYVDEAYIAAAERKPARVLRWQPIAAAAACLALVLIGAWRYLPQTQTKEAAVEEDAAMFSGAARSSKEMDAGNGTAVMMASPFIEMTVQVLEWTQDGARCRVVDPMDSGYEAGQELTVILPEVTEASAFEYDTAEPVYRVSFLMNEEPGTITAAGWTREEQN